MIYLLSGNQNQTLCILPKFKGINRNELCKKEKTRNVSIIYKFSINF